ncbi:hypothetical protein P3T36_000146 [Kitasatospora sp. MAP12-15]|uniref:diiron oxygenase n=1 Tax=unclassified Kitasatospora TaxID=2633591 RepID=UPI002474A07E|nr:diiron oxygenase [Kitasatospora sp. MAP12-44]MDH6109374.1 hypothetical protein [Kitasatospora sp. MAP12-44]
MCGIVGLFVGCTALSYCPRRLLLDARVAAPEPGLGQESAQTEDQAQAPYRSPFRSWDSRASVRSAERREIADGDVDLPYFLPELVPLAQHKAVQELPPAVLDQVLIQHLYRYLDFTTKLEQLVVNRTALGIAQGSVGLRLPEEMRFDAYRIYCDEAYHALFSADLLRQVRRRTGVDPLLPELPYFLRRLQRMQETAGAAHRQLMELMFVIVSETLISGSLAELPQDSNVVPAVREVIRDHAQDEGRHHRYFSIFLKHLWGQLDGSERRDAALMVPQLIHTFLHPDTAAMQGELGRYGFDADTACQIVAEVLPDSVLKESARSAAAQTVRLVATLDMLDIPQVAEEFAAAGLL